MLGSVIHGVAERERQENERIRLVEELQQSRKMEAIGKLSGGIAHDFNNMLVPIIGYSESIMKSGERATGEEMAAILKAARSAADLTKQLLAFSRKQILLRKPTNVSATVREMHGMLARILGEDIEVVSELEEKPWCVLADRGQLDQVVLNLCVNARDAMQRGGRLSISTENVALAEGEDDRAGGEYLKLSVGDTGTGIAGEVIERMFEPFYTLKGPNGTGLGLSVVLGIVEQHGGWIDIDSVEGTGSVFDVYLPADSVAKLPSSPVRSDADRRVIPARSGTRILLVEDEPSVMAFVTQMLKSRGYVVTPAKCREEAFEVLNRDGTEFELLFTDAMLPDGTGMGVINHAQSIAPDISILLSSGYSDDRSLLAQAEEQDIEFLSKPYSIDELLLAVETALGQGELLSA
jgi:nitrogen-specific signal transduction histidine kinase/ActR/RegA family two-component response regulator